MPTTASPSLPEKSSGRAKCKMKTSRILYQKKRKKN